MLKNVLKYIPTKFRQPLSLVRGDIQEVRLRTGRPFAVTVDGVEVYPKPDGTLSESSQYGILCTKEDVLKCFDSVCNHSVHSYARELSQGYVTIEGGNRVGICGTYVFRGNELHTVKDVSSINVRVAHAFRGSASEVYRLADFSQPRGVLIVGKPLSGKTTILRDLCRLIASRYRVSLIDERSEIASTYEGIPQADVGLKVDVFDGYPKSVAIGCAVRTMSPSIILCDEIGTEEDFKAIRWGSVCGVKFVCTAHADSIESVLQNPNFRGILSTYAFDYVCLVSRGKVLDFKTL